MIWPFRGRNTNGILSEVSVDMELLTNGISEHSPISLTQIRVSSRYVFRWFKHWHLHWPLSVFVVFPLRYFTAVPVDTDMHTLSSQLMPSVMSEWIEKRKIMICVCVNQQENFTQSSVFRVVLSRNINYTFLSVSLFQMPPNNTFKLSCSCIDFHNERKEKPKKPQKIFPTLN